MEKNKKLTIETKKRLMLITGGIILALLTLTTILILLSLPKSELKTEINRTQEIENENIITSRGLAEILKNPNTYQSTTLTSTNNAEQCPRYNLSEYQQFFKNDKQESYFSDYSGNISVYAEFFSATEDLSTADRVFLDKFKNNLENNNIRELQFTSSCSGSTFSSTIFEKSIEFLDYDFAKFFIAGGQQFAPLTADQVNLSVLIIAYNLNSEYLIFSTTLNPLEFINNEDLKGCRIKNNQTPTSYSTTVGDYGFSRTTSDHYDYLELQCVFSESPLGDKLELNSESIVRNVLNEYFN